MVLTAYVDESARRRRGDKVCFYVLAAGIADLPLQAIAAVCLHDAESKNERVRRLCLGRLLVEFEAAGADRAVLDSRRHEDDAELRLLQAWRRSGRTEAALRVDYLRSHMEPALWAADCVAGSVSWWLNGDPVGWEHLSAVTRIVDVDAS